MSSEHAFAASSLKPTISSENQDARTAPSLRWMKIMSVLLTAPLLILQVLSQSWIQPEVGLLGGFELEDMYLDVIHLQSQRHSQRICRIFVKTSACSMFHRNAFEWPVDCLSIPGNILVHLSICRLILSTVTK